MAYARFLLAAAGYMLELVQKKSSLIYFYHVRRALRFSLICESSIQSIAVRKSLARLLFIHKIVTFSTILSASKHLHHRNFLLSKFTPEIFSAACVASTNVLPVKITPSTLIPPSKHKKDATPAGALASTHFRYHK